MDELKKILDKFNPFSRLVDFFLKRAKLLEKSLKEKYSTVLRVGLLFASFLLLLGFYSLQRFENDIDIDAVKKSEILFLEGYLWDEGEPRKAFDKAIKNSNKVAMSLSDLFCVERHKANFLELVKNKLDIGP